MTTATRNNDDSPSRQTGFCPENIPDAVAALRADGARPVISRFEDGGECRVFKADFASGESWSVRVPIHVKGASRDAIVCILTSEHKILQEVGSKSLPWVPRCQGASLTFENIVGFPFLVLSWIEGSPLHWTATDPPRPIRDKVLAQLAVMHVSLIECTSEYRMYLWTLMLFTAELHVLGQS